MRWRPLLSGVVCCCLPMLGRGPEAGDSSLWEAEQESSIRQLAAALYTRASCAHHAWDPGDGPALTFSPTPTPDAGAEPPQQARLTACSVLCDYGFPCRNTPYPRVCPRERPIAGPASRHTPPAPPGRSCSCGRVTTAFPPPGSFHRACNQSSCRVSSEGHPRAPRGLPHLLS